MKLQRDTTSGAVINTDYESYIKAKNRHKQSIKQPSNAELLIYIKQLDKRISKLEAKQNGWKTSNIYNRWFWDMEK